MGLSYVTGDASDPPGDDIAVIVHVCNDVGKFAAGFAAAIARRYPTAKSRYEEWYRSGGLELGQVQWVGVGRDWRRSTAWWRRWVVNMAAQRGVHAQGNPKPLQLDALESCLQALGVGVARMVDPATIHMPRIGCGLARGTWDEVEPLIESQLCGRGLDVVVHDLP